MYKNKKTGIVDNIKNGIVIEDEEGNQFVWIPVSNISSSDVSNEKNVLNYDGSKFLIFLGRYNTISISINCFNFFRLKCS